MRARDAGACQVCGFFGSSNEVHHISWRCFGGDDLATNCILLCPVCHNYAPFDPEDFLNYQRRGGPLWEGIEAALLEMIGTYRPDASALDIRRASIDLRISLYGRHFITSPEDDGASRLDDLTDYHRQVSSSRRRLFGEPLPPVERIIMPFTSFRFAVVVALSGV